MSLGPPSAGLSSSLSSSFLSLLPSFLLPSSLSPFSSLSLSLSSFPPLFLPPSYTERAVEIPEVVGCHAITLMASLHQPTDMTDSPQLLLGEADRPGDCPLDIIIDLMVREGGRVGGRREEGGREVIFLISDSKFNANHIYTCTPSQLTPFHTHTISVPVTNTYHLLANFCWG